jgi:cell division protease FtsH
MWVAAVFLALWVIASVVTSFLHQGETLDYSQFKSLLAQGQIVEVELGKTAVQGKYMAGDNTQKAFTAIRVEDPDLTKQLDEKKVKYSGELQSEWLGELLTWFVPVLAVGALWYVFLRRMSGTEGGIMSFARSRAKIYSDDDVKVTFADVAGVDEAAQELREIVEFLKTPAKYTTIGGRIPKGVLLVGPPGTGKTLLARAVAGEAHVPSYR